MNEASPVSVLPFLLTSPTTMIVSSTPSKFTEAALVASATSLSPVHTRSVPTLVTSSPTAIYLVIVSALFAERFISSRNCSTDIPLSMRLKMLTST